MLLSLLITHMCVCVYICAEKKERSEGVFVYRVYGGDQWFRRFK